MVFAFACKQRLRYDNREDNRTIKVAMGRAFPTETPVSHVALLVNRGS